MTQPHSLVPARETCSRPTPYRILKRAPGMAFNFSSVLPHSGYVTYAEEEVLIQLRRRAVPSLPSATVHFIQQSALAS